MTPIHIPEKDSGRKALELITMLKLEEDLSTAHPDKYRPELVEIGLAILNQYIKENKRELD